MEKKLKKISKQLKGASKLHAGQAKKIDNMIKKSPTKSKNKNFVDFNNPNVEKNYKKSAEFRKYLKEKKGVTYDPKTRKSYTEKSVNKNAASALKMKTSPALAKLSASCKAAAKRKFKVYPSAYANMWAAKTQRQGKC